MKRLQNWMLLAIVLFGVAVLARPQSNVGGAAPSVGVVWNCGTTVACAATAQTGLKFVYGTAPLTSGVPSISTLTGLPFASSSSYTCVAIENTLATGNLLKFANASGSSTVITGPASVTDVIGYICVGT